MGGCGPDMGQKILSRTNLAAPVQLNLITFALSASYCRLSKQELPRQMNPVTNCLKSTQTVFPSPCPEQTERARKQS